MSQLPHLDGRRALVVGAGISGLTAATALARKNWRVVLIERKTEVTDGGGVGLSLVGNALRALAEIGVAQACVDAGIPADSVRLMRPDGELLGENELLRIGGPQWPAVVGIKRSVFHAILVEAASLLVDVRCGVTISDWIENTDGVNVSFSDGVAETFDLVVAADGIHSSTRARVMPDVRPQMTGQDVWRVPVARPHGVRCTHLFVGGELGLVGLCPISEEDAYMYVVHSSDGFRRGGDELQLQMSQLLQGYGGIVAELAPEAAASSEIVFRPLEWMLATPPWGRGSLVLIGDAAHANPPTLAQGAAMGIEDAVVLAECMTSSGSVPQRIAAFVERRFSRVKHVVEASCQLAQAEVEKRHDLDLSAVMRRSAAALSVPA